MAMMENAAPVFLGSSMVPQAVEMAVTAETGSTVLPVSLVTPGDQFY
jgi:hypothetical protein